MHGDLDDPAARDSQRTIVELNETARAMRDSMDAIRPELAALARSVVDWRTLPNVVALLELWRRRPHRG